MDLRSRLDFLKVSQNTDGGWGYFPGRSSWLEPTAYAMLALEGEAGARVACERAWQLVRSWQLPDGSWRPGQQVQDSHWTTALAVTLHTVRKEFDEQFRAGIGWLLRTAGAEGGFWIWMAKWFNPQLVELDPAKRGWPWRPENTSWIEPTAHTLLSLKKAAPHYPGPELGYRVRLGEQMVLDRRCRDGGWNYGNRRVYQMDLPSYAETTAVALLGLQGNASLDLRVSGDLAFRYWNETRSPLAKAWLEISLRNYGVPLPRRAAGKEPHDTGDVLLAALQALACEEGRCALLKPEGKI